VPVGEGEADADDVAVDVAVLLPVPLAVDVVDVLLPPLVQAAARTATTPAMVAP
jgi:hypothetical protein